MYSAEEFISLPRESPQGQLWQVPTQQIPYTDAAVHLPGMTKTKTRSVPGHCCCLVSALSNWRCTLHCLLSKSLAGCPLIRQLTLSAHCPFVGVVEEWSVSGANYSAAVPACVRPVSQSWQWDFLSGWILVCNGCISFIISNIESTTRTSFL